MSREWAFAFVFWFAFIDGLGVWLYYSVQDNFRLWGSYYYGLYTFSIFLAIGAISFGIGANYKKVGAEEDLRNKITARERYLNKSHLSVHDDVVLNSLKNELKNLIS